MSIELFGFVFHLYGFVLGLAIVVGYTLSWQQARRVGVSEPDFFQSALMTLIGGLLGARVYHLITDWQLYSHHWWSAFALWNGGLSIIGGIGGGLLALWLTLKKHQRLWLLPTLLDCIVFGMPFAQAFGRLANWINQELYGLPTTLPWGISIDPANRLVGYEHETRFHPLFIYEGVLLLLFGFVIRWLFGGARTPQNRNGKRQVSRSLISGFEVGSGNLFLLYVLYYSIIRFCLDFLRIDKSHNFMIIIGDNQIIMLITASFTSGFLIKNFLKKR